MRKIYLAFIALVLCLNFSQAQINISGVSETVHVDNMLRYDVDFTLSTSGLAYVEYAYWDGTDSIWNATGVVGPGTNISVAVIGLIENTDYDYRVVAFDADGCYGSTMNTFTTGAVPGTVGVARMDSVWSDPGFDPEGYILTNTLRANPTKVMQMFNRDGDLLWYQEFSGDPAATGDGRCQHYNLSERGTIFHMECHRIIEQAFDGTILNDIDVNAIDSALYLHHDAFWTLDGDIAAITSDARVVDMSPVGGDTAQTVVGQGFIVVDTSTGQANMDWRIFDHYDPLTSPAPGGYWSPVFPGSSNWKHANAMHQDDDGHYLVSFRFEDQIVKVDEGDGSIIWTMGRNGDFDIMPTDTFDGQHSIRALGNGDYLLFDNEGLDSLSRVIVWWIDWAYSTPAMMIDWEFVLPQENQSTFVSNCERLENDNIFIMAGAAGPGGQYGTMFEVDENENLLWYGRQDTSAYRGYWVDDLYRRPDLQMVSDDQVCDSDTSLNLVATPSGGFWSGTHVSNGTFDVQAAGIGTHTVTYKYGADEIEVDIEVTDAAAVCATSIGSSQLSEVQFEAFPNPFEQEITLSYELDKNATVKMEVYSIDGRLLSTLIDTRQARGVYHLTVDAASLQLPAGPVVIRMTKDDRPAGGRILVRQ